MILHATIELSRAELLEALTKAVKEEYRYSGRIPNGEALDLIQRDGSYRVAWGEPADVEDKAPKTPEPEAEVA